MFATALIVFREVLEAALVISIVMAAARGAPGRGQWVWLGIGGGLAGAALVAASAEIIATALSGVGQEIFNAAVLFTAVVMLAWHNIWMKQHGRELAARMSGVGRAVATGARPLYALGIVVGLALLREGSEVVLFLYGVASAQDIGTLHMLTGGLIGLAAGAGLGLAMYQGLLRIPSRHLFTVTGWMILLLAAGMAAQGARYLVQADLLPPLGTALWDTSAALPEQSILGQVLQTLTGYMARPDGVQVLFYLATVLVMGGLMKWSDGRVARRRAARAAALVTIICGLLTLQAAPPACADHKVYSPLVERGELELEVRGHVLQDDDSEEDDARKDKYEIGYGLTDRWFSSIFVEFEQEGDDSYHHTATAWENIFQLTEQGRYWLDAGLYLEYEWPSHSGEPEELEGKLLLEKSLGRWTHTANLIFDREVGGGSEDNIEASYAWRSKYRWWPELEPGVEAYGGFGHSGDFGLHDDDAHILGPVLSGRFRLARNVAIAYEVGYLVGLTDASPDGTFKWLLELETRL